MEEMEEIENTERRLYYHLSHEDDLEVFDKLKDRYDKLTKERKEYVKKFVVITSDCCGGRPRLDGHRLTIELVTCDYLNGENCYEIDDYNMDDLGDICAVWFFETWINSEYYKMPNYC